MSGAAGMGDMAVSNSIGSNIFDILLGLGFPWALRTLVVDYGSMVSLYLFSIRDGIAILSQTTVGGSTKIKLIECKKNKINNNNNLIMK